MEFSYRIEKEKAVIEKVLEPEAVVVIPEELDGCPVVELGAYVLAGSDVEELYLPPELKKIGAYGCYNCRKLRRISCYSRVNDLGAGVFAGVQTVEYLDFVLIRGERSCLKDVLSELRQTLRVRIRETEPEQVAGVGTGEVRGPVQNEARLIFPEYFEDSVENTPARIVSVETHGCGHRYRYCFQKREFQYGDYDGIFPHVQVQEPEALVAELAFGRLRYPLGLSDGHGKAYRQYLAAHWRAAGQILIGADRLEPGRSTNLEPGQLPWLVEAVLEPELWGSADHPELPSRQEVAAAYIAMAQQAGDTEMVSWLMDYRHRARQAESRREPAATEEPAFGTGKPRPGRRRRFEL